MDIHFPIVYRKHGTPGLRIGFQPETIREASASEAPMAAVSQNKFDIPETSYRAFDGRLWKPMLVSKNSITYRRDRPVTREHLQVFGPGAAVGKISALADEIRTLGAAFGLMPEERPSEKQRDWLFDGLDFAYSSERGKAANKFAEIASKNLVLIDDVLHLPSGGPAICLAMDSKHNIGFRHLEGRESGLASNETWSAYFRFDQAVEVLRLVREWGYDVEMGEHPTPQILRPEFLNYDFSCSAVESYAIQAMRSFEDEKIGEVEPRSVGLYTAIRRRMEAKYPDKFTKGLALWPHTSFDIDMSADPDLRDHVMAFWSRHDMHKRMRFAYNLAVAADLQHTQDPSPDDEAILGMMPG